MNPDRALGALTVIVVDDRESTLERILDMRAPLAPARLRRKTPMLDIL